MNDKIKKTLLWIATLPLFLVVQSIIISFNNVAYTQTYESSAWEIMRSKGFAGHWIQGPLFIFYSYSLSTAGALYMVVKMFNNYPKHGKVAFWLFAIMLISLSVIGFFVFLLFNLDDPLEHKIRSIIECFSFVFGTSIIATHFKFIRFKSHP